MKIEELEQRHFDVINKKCSSFLDAKLMNKESYKNAIKHSVISQEHSIHLKRELMDAELYVETLLSNLSHLESENKKHKEYTCEFEEMALECISLQSQLKEAKDQAIGFAEWKEDKYLPAKNSKGEIRFILPEDWDKNIVVMNRAKLADNFGKSALELYDLYIKSLTP